MDQTSMKSETSNPEELLNEIEVLRQQNAELQGLRAQYRRIQQALSESEQRFQTMADASTVMIWMAGPERSGEYFNPAWLNFTGSSLPQELGQGWTKHIHPDDLAACLDAYRAAYVAKQQFCIEYRLRRHDGQYCWMLETGTPRFLGEGELLGFIGSCLDTTERKAAEMDLFDSEKRYRSLFETMAQGVIYWDRHGNLISA